MFVCIVCTLNVHRRCVKNVANNCGINPREMADTLRSCGLNVSKNVVRFKRSHINCKVTYCLFATDKAGMVTIFIILS